MLCLPSFSFLFDQAKWYFYILLGIVDVEANFLGNCLTYLLLWMECNWTVLPHLSPSLSIFQKWTCSTWWVFTDQTLMTCFLLNDIHAMLLYLKSQFRPCQLNYVIKRQFRAYQLNYVIIMHHGNITMLDNRTKKTSTIVLPQRSSVCSSIVSC